jgi:hypothetical protein
VSPIYRQSRPAVLLLVLGALALGACREDEGSKQLARAEARYAQLVEGGVPQQDPAWDAVLAEFEAVPRDSKARPEAERRMAALRQLREPLPRRPLRRPGEPDGGSPSLDIHGHPPHPEEGADGGM